ncbi:hypothetical protein GCM10007424_06170 [Flavobacterium suaedae]|uniref:Secretion system C-terminal sorting domain-containing protein n=1 Tax=Flavobacterium suaedae TaxID=1767027 RepID=A0ABQ1JL14_9FLAO|nr:T9SS type A sorting domain-containing protein [Flavobacterium suaedae]GGB68974.1 hypothetical protein GCM10007424_06170 [Flavobacterium suaedae]
MKKFILAAAAMLTFAVQAQTVSVTGKDGVTITDGYTYTTNSLNTDEGEDGYMPIVVTNLTNDDIYVRLRMDSMENAAGNEFFIFFCFGEQCYFSVSEGSSVPSNLEQGKITAGGTNHIDDHFASGYGGDTAGENVVYNMSLVQFTSDGTEVGTLLSFSYVYNPTAGVNDIEGLSNLGINLKNTVVTDALQLDSSIAANVEIFDLNGKKVQAAAIKNGYQTIDLSALTSSIYIAKFTTEDNRTSQVKIVKK